MTSLRVAFYLRVSTGEQTTINQRLELEAVAQARGWVIAGIYEDHGVSGSKGRQQRPQLDRLLKDAVRGRFDLLAAWAVDRLGRSPTSWSLAWITCGRATCSPSPGSTASGARSPT